MFHQMIFLFQLHNFMAESATFLTRLVPELSAGAARSRRGSRWLFQRKLRGFGLALLALFESHDLFLTPLLKTNNFMDITLINSLYCPIRIG